MKMGSNRVMKMGCNRVAKHAYMHRHTNIEFIDSNLIQDKQTKGYRTYQSNLIQDKQTKGFACGKSLMSSAIFNQGTSQTVCVRQPSPFTQLVRSVPNKGECEGDFRAPQL